MVLPFGLSSENQHNNNNSNRMITPTAPPIEHHGPYVDFIIMNNDERYMIRTERKIILESSVELAKIINSGTTIATATGGRKNDNHFLINNVNKHDFELVIRYLETKFIKFHDHHHVLRILEIADRYNCPDLIIHSVKELDLQLSSLIVLDVFRSLWYYNNNGLTSLRQESGTGLIGNTITTQQKDGKRKMKKLNLHQQHPPFTPEEYLSALLNNALQLIDMQAELILTKPEMLQLRFEEFEMIVKRDALQLESEIVLFVCLADWSLEECKRKKLDLTAENRRQVLGSLCYAARYLTMSSRDFHKACDRVELLDTAEISLVMDCIDGKKLQNLTIEQTQMLERFRTARPAYAKLPIHLSDRTNPKNYSKKMRRNAIRNDDDSCWSSIGLNCLAIFACIFD